MLKQIPSQLFKSHLNEIENNEKGIKKSVLNTPLYSLHHFESYTLKKKQNITINSALKLIIIPLVGALDVITKTDTHFVHTEQVLCLNTTKHQIQICNPYEHEEVKFVMFSVDNENDFNAQNYSVKLKQNNVFSTVNLSKNISIHIGMFNDRTDTELHANNSNSLLFCYLAFGVFEIEDRLLEHEDAIAFWNCNTLTMESLYENSILIAIETSL